ncbi:HotDog domain-containing protein [Mycena latifolia]|nr:HotDog domain-containing protein [Mycena latifolia]
MNTPSTPLLLLRQTTARRTQVLRSSTHFVRTQTTIPPTPLPARRTLSTFAAVSLAAGFSVGAYALGALFPPSPISLLYPRPAPPPPSDPTSPESLAITAALEAELQSLPVLREHRSREDAAEWYEARPHSALPEAVRVNKLTSGALRGPGKLAVFPLVRVRRDEREAVVFLHVGRGLCGHDGIIHGGLLATLLDESLARNAISNLPDKVGVTATLSIKYRAPTRADQFIVIKTQLVDVKGRKAVVKGRVEDAEGTLLVEADALFVQPRYAKLLKPGLIRQTMGAPPPEGTMGTPPPPAAEPVLVAEGTALPK